MSEDTSDEAVHDEEDTEDEIVPPSGKRQLMPIERFKC